MLLTFVRLYFVYLSVAKRKRAVLAAGRANQTSPECHVIPSDVTEWRKMRGRGISEVEGNKVNIVITVMFSPPPPSLLPPRPPPAGVLWPIRGSWAIYTGSRGTKGGGGGFKVKERGGGGGEDKAQLSPVSGDILRDVNCDIKCN